LTIKTGEYGVKAMALLDAANTGAYGNPELSTVNIGVEKNPAILISGHDLNDLEMLLEQTKGTGVDVYTHSEMLPANYYPKFKEYDNLVGNYGNSWWKQKEEFATFNGPILFTTNCIVPPKDASTVARIFTSGAAGFPGSTPMRRVIKTFQLLLPWLKLYLHQQKLKKVKLSVDSPMLRFLLLQIK
jgi:hydroxylamine reductase